VSLSDKICVPCTKTSYLLTAGLLKNNKEVEFAEQNMVWSMEGVDSDALGKSKTLDLDFSNEVCDTV